VELQRAVIAPEAEQRLIRREVVPLRARTVLLQQRCHLERACGVRVEQRLLLKVEVLEHDVQAPARLERREHGQRGTALQLDARRYRVDLADDDEPGVGHGAGVGLAGGMAEAGRSQAENRRPVPGERLGRRLDGRRRGAQAASGTFRAQHERAGSDGERAANHGLHRAAGGALEGERHTHNTHCEQSGNQQLSGPGAGVLPATNHQLAGPKSCERRLYRFSAARRTYVAGRQGPGSRRPRGRTQAGTDETRIRTRTSMTRERGIALHSAGPGAATNNLDGDGRCCAADANQQRSQHSARLRLQPGNKTARCVRPSGLDFLRGTGMVYVWCDAQPTSRPYPPAC